MSEHKAKRRAKAKRVPMSEHKAATKRRNRIAKKRKASLDAQVSVKRVHVKVADEAGVDENKNAFEVGKGLNDVFEVGEGENQADDADVGESQAEDANVDDSETFGVGEGENPDIEQRNDATGTDTDEGVIEVKRMIETALVSAEIGGGFVDTSGLHKVKSKDRRWIR